MTFELEGEEIEIKSGKTRSLLENNKILSLAFSSISPHGERKDTSVEDYVSK